MRSVKPPKNDPEYVWLWNVVDAAVRDALANHPEYVVERMQPYVRMSVTKRVVGRILGELRCNAKRGVSRDKRSDVRSPMSEGLAD